MISRCTRRKCAGSPPRLWGAQGNQAQVIHGERFTPTPVGSARTYADLALPGAVHPHACGER